MVGAAGCFGSPLLLKICTRCGVWYGETSEVVEVVLVPVLSDFLQVFLLARLVLSEGTELDGPASSDRGIATVDSVW